MFLSRSLRFAFYRPNLFGLSSISSCKNSTHAINQILTQIDGDLQQRRSIDIPLKIKELTTVSPNWLQLLEGQKLLASVVHNLYQNNHHDDINYFVSILKENDFDIWGGLSTTILKSFFKQKSWSKALLWFEEMKDNGKVKHVRIYNDVITMLAENNLLKLAFYYFEEAQNQELYMTTKQIKSITHKTITQLLQCIGRQRIDPDFHDDSDLFIKMRDVDSTDIVNSVLQYMENRAESLPNQLMYTIGSFLKDIGCQLTLTTEKNMHCLNCNTLLVSDRNFSDTCIGITSNLRQHIAAQGWSGDLKCLDVLLQDLGHFDIVIDAANVLFHGKKIINHDRLKNLLSIIEDSSSSKKIALVFHQKFKKLDDFPELSFIEKFKEMNTSDITLESVCVSGMHDDVVLCYLAAKSDLELQSQGKTVSIISNDNYIDHRLINVRKHYEFLNWLRHRQRHFNNGGYLLPNSILPIVRNEETSQLHMISKDRTICCVKMK